MSIPKGVELGSASVPEVACCSRDSMSDAGFMVIFSAGIFSVALPAIPGIVWPDCDGPDMSMPSPLLWPEADAARAINNDAFKSALTNNFRTNVSLPFGEKKQKVELPGGRA